VDRASFKYGLFVQWGLLTFTGDPYHAAKTKDIGRIPASRFAPTGVDARQWAQVAKEAGMDFAILNAKFEDGFALWPSKASDYSVAQSPNKLDVVAEFMDACKKEGIVPGLLYSLIDAHNEGAFRTERPVGPPVFDLFKKQVVELLSRYPGVRVVAIDLATRLSESQYDELCAAVKRANPQCVILGDQVAPWGQNFEYGTVIASWFWLPDSTLTSPGQIFRKYAKARDKGWPFLLSVGPDKAGRIPQDQVEALKQAKEWIAHPERAPSVAVAGKSGSSPLAQWPTSVGGNGHFYEVVGVSGGITWGEANRRARNAGGYLATVTSSAESEFLLGLLEDRPELWSVGGRNWFGPWLGGTKAPGASEPRAGWSWVTGEPFTYQNWAPQQPNNMDGSENRIQLFSTDGPGNEWNDINENLGNSARGYVVEYDSEPRQAAATAPAPAQDPAQQGMIGVALGRFGQDLVITNVVDESPAAQAKLVPKQVISTINGILTAGMQLEDAMKLIRGPVGTTVTLGIRSPASSVVRTVELTRATVLMPAVRVSQVTSNVVLFEIRHYAEGAPGRVKAELERLHGLPIRGLILDLRGNGTGPPQNIEKIASYFVGSGPPLWLVRERGKAAVIPVQGKEEQVWTRPVVAIIGPEGHGGELLAAALQSTGRAKLVGQKTGGTVAIWSLQKQPDGSQQKVLFANYFTVRDEPIWQKGIKPDVPLDPGLSPKEVISKAVEELIKAD
jgi:carboxyl-terminal processing protease